MLDLVQNVSLPIRGRITRIVAHYPNGAEKVIKMNSPNTVVKTGIRAFFINNTNDANSPCQIIGRYTSGSYVHEGFLSSMILGTSGLPTSFADTWIKEPVANSSGTTLSATRLNDSNTNYNYHHFSYSSEAERNYGTLLYRISHRSITVAQACTIREIGYVARDTNFKEVNENGYHLFSRVVLETPVELTAGSYLDVTYELRIRMDTAKHRGTLFGAECEYCFTSKFTGESQRAFNLFNSGIVWNIGQATNLFTGSYTQKNGAGETSFNGQESALNPNALPYYNSSSKLKADFTDRSRNVMSYQGTSNFDTLACDTLFGGSFSRSFNPENLYAECSTVFNPVSPAATRGVSELPVYFLMFRGLNIKFGHYDNEGLWVSEPLKLKKTIEFTYRVTLDPNTNEF